MCSPLLPGESRLFLSISFARFLCAAVSRFPFVPSCATADPSTPELYACDSFFTSELFEVMAAFVSMSYFYRERQ